LHCKNTDLPGLVLSKVNLLNIQRVCVWMLLHTDNLANPDVQHVDGGIISSVLSSCWRLFTLLLFTSTILVSRTSQSCGITLLQHDRCGLCCLACGTTVPDALKCSMYTARTDQSKCSHRSDCMHVGMLSSSDDMKSSFSNIR